VLFEQRKKLRAFLENNAARVKNIGLSYYALDVRAASPATSPSGRPRVVTLMSCYNHWDYTRRGIETFYQSLDGRHDHVFMLIDDCSSDGTKAGALALAKTSQNFIYVRFKKNRGLTRSWNYGVREAARMLNADYIVIANDDILIPQDAVGRLIDGLAAAGGPAVIGPLSNSPGMHRDTQDIRKFIPGYEADDNLAAIEKTQQAVAANKIVETREINGFFFAAPAEVFLENTYSFLGRRFAFDPKNANFKNELEFQARLRNRVPPVKVLLAANDFIFHYKDVSQKRSDQGLIQNWDRFRPKDGA
jgi:GT2 family glycosyltransferase